MIQKTPQPEMPAEHAILGLLMLDDGAGHGYDLARHFTDGQPLATVLRLEAGMLYHHLKKLARAGWVTSTVEPQGSRPPRQIYRITPEGRAEVHRWLSEPVTKTREIRLEFLVKLYFAWRFNQRQAARLVAEQQETLRGLAASLTDQMARVSSDGSAPREQDAAFLRQVLALRLAQTQAAIDWLEQLSATPPTDTMA
ncbi:MAG TPA: PadR family transcriptional regulator [Thermomicrobiales bacterium]|nr:PadR family transcriptional regulator [Thermomicrobiales bacterium]